MKILVFGSLNIDRTYGVPHFVKPGETLAANTMQLFCGGKGFNQAVALARAGNSVYFAGAVGADGQMLADALAAEKIDSHYLKHTSGSSGHAIIQVTPDGQNSILIHSGANGQITPEDVKRVLADFEAGDLVVSQNEISCVPEILRAAKAKGMLVALNPSPFDDQAARYPLENVDFLFINQGEGQAITGCDEKTGILDKLHKKYPAMNVILTLGRSGSSYLKPSGEVFDCGILPVHAIDTTAAGDTFSGYFLSELVHDGNPKQALWTAAVASAIAVSRPGASASIPYLAEVRNTMLQRNEAGSFTSIGNQ